ncbi:thiol:disulfide interchange protein DsbA/DsbL [Shewanella sp. VB17]|uniref:thiol:disulfide interchange protein DsbA/DsbL n=1 Tax=Shewanella sp. VB17 TaxID=2739432 RepID=UPI0015664917|nr:thiol:disulfide interchange protein DsbA/DsbL [Shewanella sp. VB17]NRD74342.1 thiol:disulfide interchange protein DsbA/DsbL [Shewanella sp. VB17]
MTLIKYQLTAGLFILALNLFSANINAQIYVEGVDYTKVVGIPESSPAVVREFFSYNCPHCYRQDPLFEQTASLLKGKVEFTRTPIGAGRPSWILSQKAYYLTKKFKVGRHIHSHIFTRIHQKEGAFTRQEQLTDYFVNQGIKRDDVEKALDSADASLALSNYDTQAQLAGIKGVPSLLVNGKYLITSTHRTAEELAALVDYLSQLGDKP